MNIPPKRQPLEWCFFGFVFVLTSVFAPRSIEFLVPKHFIPHSAAFCVTIYPIIDYNFVADI